MRGLAKAAAKDHAVAAHETMGLDSDRLAVLAVVAGDGVEGGRS